jgi:hypothetical protein
MCLAVYLATPFEVPPRATPTIQVEDLDEAGEPVKQWFSLPHIRYVAAHGGCGCGFPSVVADEPIDWFEGFFDEAEDRQLDLASVTDLIELLRESLRDAVEVQVLPVWEGDQAKSPKGEIIVDLTDLEPAKFFSTNTFCIACGAGRRSNSTQQLTRPGAGPAAELP